MFDSLILDIDGTIWNTTEIVADAWNASIKESGFLAKLVSADDLKKEFGKPMDEIARDLWPNLSAAEQEKILEICCKKEHEYVECNSLDITYEGVVNTIHLLSDRIKLFIVSNCQNGYIELMMKKTGITPFIKDYECFGHTGLYKAENIRLVCERNSLKNTAYVGDTDGDRMASEEAGIPFIWASYGFGKAVAYSYKINSFSDLLLL